MPSPLPEEHARIVTAVYWNSAFLAVLLMVFAFVLFTVDERVAARRTCRETLHYARLAEHIGMLLTEEEEKEVEECRE